jgi:hypothetical protein
MRNRFESDLEQVSAVFRIAEVSAKSVVYVKVQDLVVDLILLKVKV